MGKERQRRSQMNQGTNDTPPPGDPAVVPDDGAEQESDREDVKNADERVDGPEVQVDEIEVVAENPFANITVGSSLVNNGEPLEINTPAEPPNDDGQNEYAENDVDPLAEDSQVPNESVATNEIDEGTVAPDTGEGGATNTETTEEETEPLEDRPLSNPGDSSRGEDKQDEEETQVRVDAPPPPIEQDDISGVVSHSAGDGGAGESSLANVERLLEGILEVLLSGIDAKVKF